MIIELYFVIFRYIARHPGGRFVKKWFHFMGAIAFLLTTIKHAKRGNKKLIISNLRGIIWQMVEMVKR